MGFLPIDLHQSAPFSTTRLTKSVQLVLAIPHPEAA